MRGKKPKDRERYVLRMEDGTLVEVTREVYLEWYQSRRREKYQEECRRKNGVCSLEQLEEKGMPFPERESLEETVIRGMDMERLREAVAHLPQKDAYLLHLLFFEEVTVKEAAQLCGCSRKTVENRRRRIFGELKCKMQKMGIVGGGF